MSSEHENESIAQQHFGDDEDEMDTVSEPVPEADFTELNVAISEAQSLNESDYTPESWALFDSTLASALATSSNASSTQEEVDCMTADLTVATECLVPSSDEEEEPVVTADTGVIEGNDRAPSALEEPPVTEPEAASDEHPSLTMVKTYLDEYSRRMARGKGQDVNNLMACQKILGNVFVTAFTQPHERLRDAGNLVFAAFRENETGAFGDQYVNRGLKELSSIDRAKALMIRGVANIILRTKDPRDRDEVLQHVDLNPLFEDIDNQDVVAGLMEYLRIG